MDSDVGPEWLTLSEVLAENPGLEWTDLVFTSTMRWFRVRSTIAGTLLYHRDDVARAVAMLAREVLSRG
jgi:hypothetical protein